jgi:hypothetical protein
MTFPPKTVAGQIGFFIGAAVIGATVGWGLRQISPWACVIFVVPVFGVSLWAAWPTLGSHTCEICGAHPTQPVERNVRPDRWWRFLIRPDVAWLCPQHFLPYLIERQERFEDGHSSRP